jgi:hypothetical protein
MNKRGKPIFCSEAVAWLNEAVQKLHKTSYAADLEKKFPGIQSSIIDDIKRQKAAGAP